MNWNCRIWNWLSCIAVMYAAVLITALNMVNSRKIIMRKLFRFSMYENGKIDKEAYQYFCEPLKEGIPVWQEECADFNDWQEDHEIHRKIQRDGRAVPERRS